MGKSSQKRRAAFEEGPSVARGLPEKPVPAREPCARSSTPETGHKTAFIIAAILIVSAAVYLNALQNGFVYDDNGQILRNLWIRDIKYLPEIFSKSVWAFQAAPVSSNYYRPVMHTIYMVTYYIFGLRPWGFHLVNLLFHAANSVMVFVIMSRLLGESAAIQRKDAQPLLPPERSETSQLGSHSSFTALRSLLTSSPSFIAALLFATHPIHTEAVTWVAGLPEISFTFFSLLAFYLYVRSGRDFNRDYFLSVSFFFLAALCKETALTLPLIIIAFDFAFQETGRSVLRNWKRYAPYLVLSVVYLALRVHALGGFAPSRRFANLDFSHYLINVFPLFMQYLEKLIIPLNLNAFHVLHPIGSFAEWMGIAGAICAVAFAAACFLAARKNRFIFFCLLLTILPLLPVLYIPFVGENAFAERYCYLPSVGFAAILAVAFSALQRKAQGSRLSDVAMVVALFVAGTYGLLAIERNAVWRDDLTLFTDTVRKSPDGAIPRAALGMVLFHKGRWTDAYDQLMIASRLEPADYGIHNNIGLLFLDKGWTDKAIEQFRTALRLDPDFAEAHSNLGLALAQSGQLDSAIEEYRIAVDLVPGYADAHGNLGTAYASKGLISEAVEEYRTTIALDPENSKAHYSLGLAFLGGRQLENAVREFVVTSQLEPDHPEVFNSMGAAYAEMGRMDRAIECFETSVRLHPDSPFGHYNLGMAYEQRGLVAQAVAQLEEAVRLKPSDPGFRSALADARKKNEGKRSG